MVRIRLTILGFTAMCRYTFAHEDWVQEGWRKRFLHPRVFSQVGSAVFSQSNPRARNFLRVMRLTPWQSFLHLYTWGNDRMGVES